MDEHKIAEISVAWRGKQLNVEIDRSCSVKEFGQILQDVTNVKPDTLRLIVPQSEKKSSRLVTPFSDLDSSLSLRDAGIIQGKSIRMMGVFEDEIEEVSENKKRPDMRIIGFDEEENRLRQRSSNRVPVSLKLPQGPYIFGDFRTLHLPGIELNPPPSEVLKRMHMLACDPGIIAIMNKYKWRVGIMTEMAPVGSVGVSPKCILGFNKNKGEEISLRLRTDDLKGFRKYEVIKKTLIHELTHMVHSEHDANFFALNKQLTGEAANLDWTKSKGHTLNGCKNFNTYGEEEFLDTVAKPITANKLGGEVNPFASPRASSVAAAYQRFITISARSSEQAGHGSEPDPDEKASGPTRSITADLERMATVSEPDPDETLTEFSGDGSEPDPDEKASGLTTSVTADLERVATVSEPDPDETLTEMNFTLSDGAERTVDNPEKVTIPLAEEDLVTKEVVMDLDETDLMEPDPDDTAAVTKYQTKVGQGSHREQHSSSEPDPDDRIDSLLSEDLQRIEEPVAEICSRLQKTVQMLRSEANPVEVPTVLQTLSKIIRNVIEHPDNVKFRKLRKNKGEEISLRLRTDDLKGFRKYEVIKKTLIHELTHMVHSEHDANFFALNKQLTGEAANLDWTKSKGHTLNGRKNFNTYGEEEFLDTVAKPITANKLGGEVNPFASPRASSVAAAYQRFITISARSSEQAGHGSEPDPDEKASGPTRSITADLERMATVSEPDPDETLTVFSGDGSEPDPDEKASGLTTSVTADLERVATVSEPDPDETLTEMNFTLSDGAERTVDNPEKVTIPLAEEDLVTKEVVMDLDETDLMEPDPDDTAAVTKYQTEVGQGSHREQHSSSEPDPDDRIDSLLSEDLQRIEEPVAEICSRLQKTVQMLRSEANPVEVPTVLQTLSKIIRNVIEHPDNVKFRKLCKANPQFQRNVANYTAARC